MADDQKFNVKALNLANILTIDCDEESKLQLIRDRAKFTESNENDADGQECKQYLINYNQKK